MCSGNNPYITISETDVEEQIKLALGLDARLTVDGALGYVSVMEVLAEAGETVQEDFRDAALDGIYGYLKIQGAWLKHKVSEYLKEQKHLAQS